MNNIIIHLQRGYRSDDDPDEVEYGDGFEFIVLDNGLVNSTDPFICYYKADDFFNAIKCFRGLTDETNYFSIYIHPVHYREAGRLETQRANSDYVEIYAERMNCNEYSIEEEWYFRFDHKDCSEHGTENEYFVHMDSLMQAFNPFLDRIFPTYEEPRWNECVYLADLNIPRGIIMKLLEGKRFKRAIDLSRAGKKSLLSIDGIGKKSVELISQALKNIKLELEE